MAQALASTTPDRAHEVVVAFVSGAQMGLRVIGVTVLVLGGLVVLQSLLSRRRAPVVVHPPR
jgi:Na+/H+-translocating membrane pyrophosphatase